MSKREPYPQAEDTSGKRYWRSLAELHDDPEVMKALEREFPEGYAEPPDGVSRRSFFQVMGASLAMAGLASCRRPEEKILPYSRAPEDVIPGVPMQFATAMPWDGSAIGLLVTSHEGRPTKIEGNPGHPDSLGSTSAWVQASVLNLYDPDRSDGPREQGVKKSWDDAIEGVFGLGKALQAEGGNGLVVLTEGHRSPTLKAALDELRRRMPGARVMRYEPFSRDNVREGARLAYGRPFETVLNVAEADVIVALDSDFLYAEGSSVKHARGFAKGRQPDRTDGRPMNRLYAVESRYSVTGGNADHRLRLQSRLCADFIFVLAAELAAAGVAELEPLRSATSRLSNLPTDAGPFAKALAKDLAGNRGRGLLVGGYKLPAVAQALVHIINSALGNTGRTVTHHQAFEEAPEGPGSMAQLAMGIRSGQVKTVVVLGGNPAFNAPGDLEMAKLLEGITTIHLSEFVDETSTLAEWHLPRAHYLESWSDVVSETGQRSVVQPLIAPLFDGKTDAELVWMLMGQLRKPYDLVRETWASAAGAGDVEKTWRHVLHDGVYGDPDGGAAVTARAAGDLAQAVNQLPMFPPDSVELTYYPDPHAYDGRFANNAWMQEMPDPMYKSTWQACLLVAEDTAAKIWANDGELFTVKMPRPAGPDAGNNEASAVALLAVGQAENSIALSVGQGRRGTVAEQAIGTNAYAVRFSSSFDILSTGALADEAEGYPKPKNAITQGHFLMHERPLVREATLTAFKADPAFTDKMKTPRPAAGLVKLYGDQWSYESGHKWGMVIDLNTCIGCNACMVACQAENNIPVVGREGVMRSREMHWIRVDRYFEGNDKFASKNPRTVTQPIPCMHCEMAPCEQVCPVGATTHSPEGLNDMAYNRCIGTRYCANNCPYKVRRFNFFNYTNNLHELRKMQMNPDVTVRSRGVVEKCTYCVQRINRAKIAAHRVGQERVLDETKVTPACAQSCPSGAITFGDLNNKDHTVAKLAASPRNYAMLDEINTRPRTTYLGKIRNLNPELA
jgi:MoCo/4Fe-4S cofactor protein with predicted Tat translocation signal